MAWATKHPDAISIDPTADRATIIGSTWQRRTPEGDAWDGPVRIVGIFDTGNDVNGIELVVQTVAFTGQPTLTSDATSFVEAYARCDDGDPIADLRARVQQLESRAR